MREHRYFVYIVASRSHTLYIGVTSNIAQRMEQHRAKAFEGFSGQYNCNRLVYLEKHDEAARAISREKQLKRWSRSKKLTLINRVNPTWQDLSKGWGEPLPIVTRLAEPAGLSTTAPPSVEMTATDPVAD